MDSIDETRPLIVSGGEDIFEITDFTVISDFEQFIVTLENAIHEWNLGTSEAKGVKRKVSKRFSTDFFQTCNWKNESKFITYPPHSELLLTHVWPEDSSSTVVTENNDMTSEDRFPVATNDLLLTESNFYPWSIITQQFGVFEYLLLSPAKDDSNNVTSENEAQMILSAIDIATINSECTLPIFLQFGAPDRIFFIGSVQNGNIKTRFETVHTHHAFSKHKCLSGLVDIFKERLNDSTIPALDITVAIELEYILRNDFDYDNDLNTDERYIKNLGVCSLPFGTRRDVVKEFRLLTGWPALKQEAITDTINYSDLDPYAAPRWRASVTFHKGVQGLLHCSLSKAKEYLKSIDEETVMEKLGPKPTEKRNAAEIFRPVVDGGSGMNINIGAVQLPLNETKLTEIVTEIFNVGHDSAPSNHHFNEVQKDCENTLKSAKAAVSGSIVDSLTKSILLTLVQPDSTKNRTLAICQIWEAFTEKLRTYWETNRDIPGLEDTVVPDLSKCLLHQKLQMIQCCIDSRRKRHELFDQTKNFATHEDEFYDAPDEFSITEETPLTSMDTVNYEPEGRLEKSETLKLLHRPEQPLYFPITQDRSPMTEDMLEEHAEYLASMPGDDRVKAQLDTLLSDMQAFKAANPGCCIEDFVRWHSPRDYVEEEDGTGHLSERMDVENNVWRTTWKEARPMAVAHQNRLFNESKEAEKILHSFMYFKISDIFKMLMPMALISAIRRLIEEADECYPIVQRDLKKLVAHVTRYTHRLSYDECLASLNLIQKIESIIGEYSSLKTKFDFNSDDKHDIGQLCADNDTIRTFVLDLMSVPPPDQAFANASPELTTAPVTIIGAPNGPLAMSIRRLLHKDSRLELEEAEKAEGSEPPVELKFPPITRKHYVLRCTGAREHGSPRVLPQRMSASIDGDDFRLCLSLSSDLTFA